MCAFQVIFFVVFVCFQKANGIDNEIESRVHGGTDLQSGAHKHLVRLGTMYNRFPSGACSGSIIDISWILTAAHCFDHRFDSVNVFHLTHDQPDSERLIATVQKNDVILYPFYVPSPYVKMNNIKNDIALIKTTLPMELNNYVQPVELSTSAWIYRQEATVAGFGMTEEGTSKPREGIVVAYTCLPGVICSRDRVRPDIGDSGGPLVSQGRLIGVTSSGTCKGSMYPCEAYYVDVYRKLRWIWVVISNH